MFSTGRERTPAFKLLLAIVVGLVLTIPLFSVWLLVYDRKSQSEEASACGPPQPSVIDAVACSDWVLRS